MKEYAQDLRAEQLADSEPLDTTEPTCCECGVVVASDWFTFCSVECEQKAME